MTACGGGDDATPEQPSGSTASSGDAAVTAEPNESAETSEAPGTSDAAASDAGASQTGGLACDDIFGPAEMEAWFGEPVETSEERTDSLGQLVCTWETIEDPDDLDDLTASVVTAQVFSGDPVPAANFIDPDIYDEVTMLEGFGDVAFFAEQFGRSYHFYDEPVAGSLSFADINMGSTDPPVVHTPDELEALFSTFHERVTG